MNQTFILQNQDKLFFGKNKEWVDGYDANGVFKTPYKDEAINQMVEVSSKDYKQRVKIITCDLNEKGLPVIDPEIMPAPLPKVPKAGKSTDDLFAETAPEASPVTAEHDEPDIPEEPEDQEEVLEFTVDDTAEDPENNNNQANLL